MNERVTTSKEISPMRLVEIITKLPKDMADEIMPYVIFSSNAFDNANRPDGITYTNENTTNVLQNAYGDGKDTTYLFDRNGIPARNTNEQTTITYAARLTRILNAILALQLNRINPIHWNPLLGYLQIQGNNLNTTRLLLDHAQSLEDNFFTNTDAMKTRKGLIEYLKKIIETISLHPRGGELLKEIERTSYYDSVDAYKILVPSETQHPELTKYFYQFIRDEYTNKFETYLTATLQEKTKKLAHILESSL